jgi:hypothetical protein
MSYNSTSLLTISGVLDAGGSFERDVSDPRRAGVIAFQRVICRRLENAVFELPNKWILILTTKRKVYCKAQ